MPERLERPLRLACLVLAGALLVRVGWSIAHYNPLAHLKIPDVPTLEAKDAGGKGTNNLGSQSGATKGSNALPALAGKPASSTRTNGTEAARTSGTNAGESSLAQNTNSINPSIKIAAAGANAPGGTNVLTRTNVIAGAAPEQSHSNSLKGSEKRGTNVVAEGRRQAEPSGNRSPAIAAGNMPQGPGKPAKARELPLAIQARVDRITDSEVLGPVMRPLPLALLGIAGNVAFLRASNGQTGVVKEGDDLGGLKLVRIGINRVLVEEDGQKKELTIFAGLGGESLLPNDTKPPP